MDVSENSGTPKSSILIGFSIIFTIHFGGNTLFLETPIYTCKFSMVSSPSRKGVLDSINRQVWRTWTWGGDVMWFQDLYKFTGRKGEIDMSDTYPPWNEQKMDARNTFSFPFGMAYFQMRTVSFRECIFTWARGLYFVCWFTLFYGITTWVDYACACDIRLMMQYIRMSCFLWMY